MALHAGRRRDAATRAQQGQAAGAARVVSWKWDCGDRRSKTISNPERTLKRKHLNKVFDLSDIYKGPYYTPVCTFRRVLVLVRCLWTPARSTGSTPGPAAGRPRPLAL